MVNKLSKKYSIGILTQALKQGITPKKLAITVALGILIGIFPIMGTSTLICLGISIVFRLNIAVMQLANYLVTAIQVLCILPFMKLGGYLFGLRALSYSRDQLILLFQNDFWRLLRDSGTVLAGGVGAWLMVSIPLFFVLYTSLLFFFMRWRLTNSTRDVNPGSQ